MAKKKVKLNDKVNTKNKKGINIDKYETDEAKEVKRFVFILLGIIIVVLACYGITKVVKDKKTGDNEENATAGVIDYDKVSVGTILNRNINEDYVIVYNQKDENAMYYSAIVTKYLKNDKAKKVFFCDLDNELNAKFYSKDKESNPKAKDASEFSFKDLTLIKVKNGKVDKYIEDLDTIKAELSI